MKFVDKQVVETTKPTIYIGKRTYKSQKTGEVRTGGPYWAEYFTNGKQYQEPLYLQTFLCQLLCSAESVLQVCPRMDGAFIIAPSDHFFDAESKLIVAYADEAGKCVYN